MRMVCSFLRLIGRICLGGAFLFAGLSKVLHPGEASIYMEIQKMSWIPLWLFLAAVIELGGALALMSGYRIKLGATILLFFLALTTYFFHGFWNMEKGEERRLQVTLFLNNLAIAGGLLYVIAAHSRPTSSENQHASVQKHVSIEGEGE